MHANTPLDGGLHISEDIPEDGPGCRDVLLVVILGDDGGPLLPLLVLRLLVQDGDAAVLVWAQRHLLLRVPSSSHGGLITELLEGGQVVDLQLEGLVDQTAGPRLLGLLDVLLVIHLLLRLGRGLPLCRGALKMDNFSLSISLKCSNSAQKEKFTV